MKMLIHPYLVARFKAVQAAFMQSNFRTPTVVVEQKPLPSTNNNWYDLFDDEDDEGGGGGGTIRGNRGKNAVHAKKAEMRRLARGGVR